VDGLLGIRAGDWWRLLGANGFAVSPGHWKPATAITIMSLFNALRSRKESQLYDAQLAEVKVREPIFVLGHWRSGTTLLHSLLVTDPQFAYANAFQVSHPLTFLQSEEIVAERLKNQPVRKRPQDNVEYSMDSPGEDEFGVCAISLRSPVLGWTFPRREAFYDRYLTFRKASADDIRRWQDGLRLFLKKLTWKYQRPLILKSPQHTARIRLLLEMFPDARFIHIHRNPYQVFHSTRKLYDKVISRNHLHAHPHGDQINELILKRYNEMYDAFFEERGLIPEGQYCELGFEELEADKVGQVARIYQALNLAGFEQHRPALQKYVDSIANYEKNVHPEMDEHLRRRIGEAWKRSFDEWGYAL
jgi:LPS sulfotransferase NodH